MTYLYLSEPINLEFIYWILDFISQRNLLLQKIFIFPFSKIRFRFLRPADLCNFPFNKLMLLFTNFILLLRLWYYALIHAIRRVKHSFIKFFIQNPYLLICFANLIVDFLNGYFMPIT